jgi:hypothetical protein
MRQRIPPAQARSGMVASDRSVDESGVDACRGWLGSRCRKRNTGHCVPHWIRQDLTHHWHLIRHRELGQQVRPMRATGEAPAATQGCIVANHGPPVAQSAREGCVWMVVRTCVCKGIQKDPGSLAYGHNHMIRQRQWLPL